MKPSTLLPFCCIVIFFGMTLVNATPKLDKCELNVKVLRKKLTLLQTVMNNQDGSFNVVLLNFSKPNLQEIINLRDRIIKILQRLVSKKKKNKNIKEKKKKKNTKKKKKKNTKKKKKNKKKLDDRIIQIKSYKPLSHMEQDSEFVISKEKVTIFQEFNCPSSRIAATSIPNLPAGSRVDYSHQFNSLDSLGSNLVRSCAECHYQITLPYGYMPRYHAHVILPSTKPNCIGGLGRCAKNEVVMTIMKDGSNDIRLPFNKGCSCQMLAEIAAFGDGN